MKLSCIDAIVPGETLKDKSENLERYGFEGVDIRTGCEDLGQREKEISEIASRSKVRPFLCNCSPHFTKNEEHCGRQA